MAKVDQALDTLSKLQLAAPPMTAQRLSEVINLIRNMEQENDQIYARLLDAESKVLPGTGSVGDLAESTSDRLNPGDNELLESLFDSIETGVLDMPPALVHPDDSDSGGAMDFDAVFAEILASRNNFDTGTLSADAGPPTDEDDANPAIVTSKLPKRSTDISHESTPSAETLLQRFPGFMRPILTTLRDQTSESGRVNPYAETALKMLDSVEQIHDMRRGLFSLKPFSFQPKDLLKQARKEMLPRAATQDHQIIMLADDDLPQIFADGERAFTILCDLLDNAIRYTPVSGTIRLTADSLGTHVLFSVSDTGIGITEDDIAQIGTPFWRATHQPMVARQPGAGLRLFLVRRMLALMGGEFFISGEPALGSSFSFTLPVLKS